LAWQRWRFDHLLPGIPAGELAGDPVTAVRSVELNPTGLVLFEPFISTEKFDVL